MEKSSASCRCAYGRSVIRSARCEVLTYPLSDWGAWFGPIGPHPTASLFAAVQHLRAAPRDWDLLDLRWIGAEPDKPQPTSLALQASGWLVSQSDYQQTSVVRLDGLDWATYRTRLSKKWRHEVVRQQRNLRREFDVSVERHRPQGGFFDDGEPRWDLYDQCLKIAEQSWQSSSTDGTTLSDGQVRSFLRECHEVAARLGMVDVSVLRLDGQPAAFHYNYHYDGNLFGLRMGYAREFALFGVGKSLLAWMIEDGFARGDRAIDLGPGEYAFKRNFRTGVETSQRFTYYPPTALRGQGVRLTQWVKSRFAQRDVGA